MQSQQVEQQVESLGILIRREDDIGAFQRGREAIGEGQRDGRISDNNI
jgi:hypothetical protein